MHPEDLDLDDFVTPETLAVWGELPDDKFCKTPALLYADYALRLCYGTDDARGNGVGTQHN